MGFEFTRRFTDFETGEIVTISLGEHPTFTELAIQLRLSQKRLVELLTAAGWVHQEYDEKARKFRNRLKQGAVDAGLGYRLSGLNGIPFDRLTPAAVEWISEELPNWLGLVGGLHDDHINEMREALKAENGRRCERLDTEGQVRFLTHHFPNAKQTDIALALSTTERTVRRHQKKMGDQRDHKRRKAERELPHVEAPLFMRPIDDEGPEVDGDLQTMSGHGH